jgi:hypothetical protein
VAMYKSVKKNIFRKKMMLSTLEKQFLLWVQDKSILKSE